MVTTFIDITERKEVERQLLIAESAIRTCISAIATADLNGNLTYVDPTFLNIWGYGSTEELLGRNVVSLCRDEERAQEVLQALLANMGTEASELVAKRKDGTEFTVGLKVFLIMDAEGQPVGMTASLADITERQKVEQKRKKTP